MRFDHRASIIIVTALSGCSVPGSPIGPGLSTTSHFSIEGPASGAPGSVLRYRGVLTQSSGIKEDVTDRATWDSENPGLLTVGAPGVYSAAHAPGEANIRATYQGAFAIDHVYVLDAGTFALHGHVRDGTLPIPGARVAVTAGAGSGRQTVADINGAYSLVGVGGSAIVAATFDGYQPQTATLDGSETSLDVAIDFGLTPVAARPDISGSWTLTFAASPSCTELPAEAMQRTYPLTISQSGASLTINFTVPHSVYGSDSFKIGATLLGSTLAFTLPDDPVDGPWLEQMLDSGDTFTLAGHATASVTGGAFQGHLDGPAQVFTKWPGVICDRTDHSLALARGSQPRS
jgi:hypothetical protein